MDKHRKSIEFNYKKTPHFNTFSTEILSVLTDTSQYLADYTINIVLCLRDLFGISVPVLRSSELDGKGTKADLLATLCEQVGATEYISVPGSSEYLEESVAFTNRGIPVCYFNYDHPQYPQLFGDFLPYMSSIDMLFNFGSKSLSLIERSCKVTS